MPLDAHTKEVLQWVDSKADSDTASSGSMDDVHAKLKDGLVLARLMNKLQPGCIKKVNKMKMPFMQMENIGFVIEAIRAYGIEDSYNFVTVDLFENKNMTTVIKTLDALRRKAS